MLIINYQNIEELIFMNKHIHQHLPHLRHLIDQWVTSHRLFMPYFKQQAKLDMLAKLPENIELLENFFNDTIIINSINQNITLNKTIPLDGEINEDFNNFTANRDEKCLYITFWR